MRLFVGKAVKDEAALIQARTGESIGGDWLGRFRERRNEALVRDVKPIRNAIAAVAGIHSHFGARIACASEADRFKVELQLDKCRLMPYFSGRIFSDTIDVQALLIR